MITPKRYQRIVNNIESILHLMRDKNQNIYLGIDNLADRKNVDYLVNYEFKNSNDLEKKLIIDNYSNGSFKFISGVALNEYLKTYEEIKDVYSFKY